MDSLTVGLCLTGFIFVIAAVNVLACGLFAADQTNVYKCYERLSQMGLVLRNWTGLLSLAAFERAFPHRGRSKATLTDSVCVCVCPWILIAERKSEGTLISAFSFPCLSHFMRASWSLSYFTAQLLTSVQDWTQLCVCVNIFWPLAHRKSKLEKKITNSFEYIELTCEVNVVGEGCEHSRWFPPGPATMLFRPLGTFQTRSSFWTFLYFCMELMVCLVWVYFTKTSAAKRFSNSVSGWSLFSTC